VPRIWSRRTTPTYLLPNDPSANGEWTQNSPLRRAGRHRRPHPRGGLDQRARGAAVEGLARPAGACGSLRQDRAATTGFASVQVSCGHGPPRRPPAYGRPVVVCASDARMQKRTTSPTRGDAAGSARQAFRDVNERMRHAMAVQPSGDVDRDFAAGMLPHHVGAVEMAPVELRYGRDPEMRRLAEAIVAAQEDEIALMREWLARGSCRRSSY